LKRLRSKCVEIKMRAHEETGTWKGPCKSREKEDEGEGGERGDRGGKKRFRPNVLGGKVTNLAAQEPRSSHWAFRGVRACGKKEGEVNKPKEMPFQKNAKKTGNATGKNRDACLEGV